MEDGRWKTCFVGKVEEVWGDLRRICWNNNRTVDVSIWFYRISISLWHSFETVRKVGLTGEFMWSLPCLFNVETGSSTRGQDPHLLTMLLVHPYSKFLVSKPRPCTEGEDKDVLSRPFPWEKAAISGGGFSAHGSSLVFKVFSRPVRYRNLPRYSFGRRVSYPNKFKLHLPRSAKESSRRYQSILRFTLVMAGQPPPRNFPPRNKGLIRPS